METEPDFTITPEHEEYLRRRQASWRRFNIIAGLVAAVILAAIFGGISYVLA